MRGRISGLIFLLTIIVLSSQGVKAQWRQVNTGTSDQINGAYAPTPGLITIVTNSGNAMHSTDGGQTWHHNQLMPGESFNSVAGFNDPFSVNQPVIAVGDNGSKWRSTDGGQNWVRDDFQTSNDMFDVAVDPNPSNQSNVNFWASGENGTIFHSSNNGQMWQQQSAPFSSERLFGIAFGNSTNGIIGGNYWIIYNTTNGGSSWNYQSTPVSGVDFMGTAMGSSTQGWAVGTGGTIIHTTNGGSSWTQQISGTSNTLNDVLFGNETNGWAVGSSGTILHTTNGGSNWSQQQTGFTGDFTSIAIDNEGNAYVTGSDGALFTNAPEPQQQPTFNLGRDQINIAVTPVNDAPVNTLPGQDVRVDVNPVNDAPTLDWGASSSENWLNVTPEQGQGTGLFTVSIENGPSTPGTYQATVTVTDVNDPDQTQSVPVNVEVFNPGTTQPPFGSFDTPANGSTVQSSVPVTGWALDDVGVDNVKIYRQGSEGSVYVGDAALVEGARPDVEAAYPDYPNNYKAGWGYMLLTNFLPNNGNGTFTFEAIATDYEGNTTSLGTKTISVDNAHAVKPFGAIDAPQAGGTASGNAYRNWGWALTPHPNRIPSNGSSISVYVDGVNAGNAGYNIYRSDIATLFPGYSNSKGAGVQFIFNTTEYANGVHSIQWTASDDAGNSDGIGSRFFTIQNPSSRSTFDDLGSGTPFLILNSSGPIISTDVTKLTFGAQVGGGFIAGNKFNFTNDITNAGTPHTQVIKIENTGGSPLNWTASADEDWISFDPASGTAPSWLAVIVDPSGLTAGDYQGTVKISDANNDCAPAYISVYLTVYSDTEAPFGDFTFPDEQRVTAGTINITGWALDDIGIASLEVFRQDGDNMVSLGNANFVRDARPDIVQAYSNYPFNNLAGWNLSFTTNTLPDGDYYFEAVATDYEDNTTTLEGSTFTIDNANSTTPFGDIDSPMPGEIISGENYQVSGWALTPLPNTIPTDGSTINVLIDGVNVGSPVYNISRSDIADLFPGYNNSNGAGGTFTLNTTEYVDGVHTIAWSVTDDQGNVNGSIGAHEFVIQNNSNITVDVDDEELEIPKETVLMPAYPNPFNPSTTIRFTLSQDAKVDVIVYDILGRKVVSLINGEFKNAGSYNVYWSGKNDFGRALSSGVYLVTMHAGSYIQTQKIVLLK